MSFQLCRSDEVILVDMTNIPLLTYENIHTFHGANGKFYFRFKIQIVNNNAVPISDSAELRIDSQRKFHLLATIVLTDLVTT